MSSFNKVILVGNLTRDPEVRTAGATNTKVAELGLAVSENWRDRSGQQKETTCFVDVVVWDRLAELCGQYLTKGRKVLVEGRLQMDEWTNKQGERRTKLRVRADTVKFLGGPSQRRDDAEGAPYQSSGAAPTAQSAPPVSVPPVTASGNHADELTDDDEQLPF